jgi:acyl carrier protein
LVRTIDQDDDLLAHLAKEARHLRQTSKPVVAPRTETERTLVAIWSDVLAVAEVGIEDDYVNDLGGTSLLAVSVFARIARELGVSLPLATLVEAPTIAALGGRIDQPVEQQSLVLLNGGGNGTPLFLVHDADGETLLYRNLAQRLGDRPVYGVQPHARAGSPIVHTRIPDMAAHYLAEIRKLYPHGPYLLGGLCAGGIIASEMVLQLEDVGETARLVAVFDAAAVEAPRKPHLEDRRRLERVRQAWGEQSLAQASRAIAAKLGGYVAYQVQSTFARICCIVRPSRDFATIRTAVPFRRAGCARRTSAASMPLRKPSTVPGDRCATRLSFSAPAKARAPRNLTCASTTIRCLAGAGTVKPAFAPLMFRAVMAACCRSRTWPA